jgi:hypothetical protein
MLTVDRWCGGERTGIVLTAYSPLGSTVSSEGVVPLLENEVVKDIAAEVGRSAAQVVLRWGVQKHITVRLSLCCIVCVRLCELTFRTCQRIYNIR